MRTLRPSKSPALFAKPLPAIKPESSRAVSDSYDEDYSDILEGSTGLEDKLADLKVCIVIPVMFSAS